MSDAVGGGVYVGLSAAARLFWALLCLLLPASSAAAAITIEGVADQKVYADRVSFTVRSEAGFDYTVHLNDRPVATDTTLVVDEPDYYELNVHRRRQSPRGEESRLVQFIVRATDRKNSEWGLPRWTPYPSIDSATAEFADGALEIITPASYPLDLEIPVIARVYDPFGRRLGVNGTVTADGFPNHPLQLLRGVGSVFLPAVAEPADLSHAARIHSLAASKTIVIEPSTAWQPISGDVSDSVIWRENVRVRITGMLHIASGARLTIGRGSVVTVDPGVEIVVDGHIVVSGTLQQPVVFTCRDRRTPWGGFVFETGSSRGEFTGVILTGSGADPDWFDNNPGHGHSHRHNQCLFYLSDGARVSLTDCFLVENHGQAGHGENAYLTMTRCLVQKCITAGQYNGGAVTLDDCALIEFPSETAPFADEDNDALYLTGGAHSLEDCLIGWALDDGIDAGSGAAGSVDVRRCWFESIYHEAMAWSEPRIATVVDTVALNCGQGIECGFGNPEVDAVHCLSTANLVGARFGDNYDWDYDGFLAVRNSLLLFNQRDVWGRAWDDWTVHLSQMDIRNNYLSIADADFPENRIWAPQADPNQAEELTSFLPTVSTAVGIGLATLDEVVDLTSVFKGIPVRLSRFTTKAVSIDYTIDSGDEELSRGSLHFTPGATIQRIPLPAGPNPCAIQVTLSEPVNAELTGRRTVTVQGECRTTGPRIRGADD